MSIPILVVDRDPAINAREAVGWKQRGINVLRVDTMRQGIEKLLYGTFRFVAINADNIAYLPLLPVMRETTATPIFIITSHFSIRAQIEALHTGADVYAPFQSSVEDNILSALAILHRYSEQRQRTDKPIICRDLVIDLNLYVAFMAENRLDLSPLNFKILHYLAINRGRALHKESIYSQAWDEDNCLDVDGTVTGHIHSIRQELSRHTDEPYIETVWGIGFRMIDVV